MEQFINLDESYFLEAAELFSSSFAWKRSGQMKFQRAEKADLEEVFRLYKSAIAKMDEQNIPQWDEVYPDRATLEDDIKKNQMFVGEKDGKIAVCFVLNEECDEEYKNGKWICPDSRFCVIHRLCGLAKGTF